jgi:hypothetical protein
MKGLRRVDATDAGAIIFHIEYIWRSAAIANNTSFQVVNTQGVLIIHLNRIGQSVFYLSLIPPPFFGHAILVILGRFLWFF